MVEPQDILFLGMDKSAVFWYRCALPALHMGSDWCGIYGEPPHIEVATGLVRYSTSLPRFEDYKVVIMQQPAGTRWLHRIRELQDHGIKVIFEIDDYLHGVRKQEDHGFRTVYTKDLIRQIELNMRVADALCCSTEWLGKKYRAFNKKVYVCENAIDVARYRLTRPERDTINIGWAGATGHVKALIPWLQMVKLTMEKYDHVNFVAIGQPDIAGPFQELLGEDRAIGVPWTLIENYPAAMTLMDIAIAPTGNTAWWRGKSDLRWLEAGALGVPIVADPRNYGKITHGVDGFHATRPQELLNALDALIQDQALRDRVGAAAKAYVHEHRDIGKNAGNWLAMAQHLVDGAADGVTPL